VQFAKARKLRCFATGTTSRIPQLSEVPTVAEQGVTLRGAMPREGTASQPLCADIDGFKVSVDNQAASSARVSRSRLRSG
nr:hypothetical protein [Burkholderiaceae bacterium]